MVLLQEVKDAIFEVIGREGTPIHKIAEKAGVSVQTTSKYCYVLEAEGKIKIERFGNMKLIKRSSR